MKFGVREICDVCFKAKAPMTIGKKRFYANEPVIYFDSLKTSTLEGAVTTVYAQGGKGNARLIGWDGEKTVTFTMEDALISPVGMMILTGAGLIEAGQTDDKGNTRKIIQHITEKVEITSAGLQVNEKPYVGGEDSKENYIYVMTVDDKGEVDSEPYLYTCTSTAENGPYTLTLKETVYANDTDATGVAYVQDPAAPIAVGTTVLVDYYTERNVAGSAQQINIGANSFAGNFYVEASTLFRNENGQDLPAEFIIPNAKVQSNFTFTMASTGDPSTFTFTMDAFPDYTRFDQDNKVFAAIQIIDTTKTAEDTYRKATVHNAEKKAD